MDVLLSKKVLYSTILAGMLMLAGCSSSDGSSGNIGDGGVTSSPASGLVVDGYIANGHLYADLDGSKSENTGDVNTTTDASGNFSFGGTEIPHGTYLYLNGGTDLATNAPFTGVLSASFHGEATVVSPLSTIVASLMLNEGLTNAAATTRTAAMMDLNETQIAADPMTDPAVFIAAQRIVAVATTLGGDFTEAVDALAASDMNITAAAAALPTPVDPAGALAVDTYIIEMQALLPVDATADELAAYQVVITDAVEDPAVIPDTNDSVIVANAFSCLTFDAIKGSNSMESYITTDLSLSACNASNPDATIIWSSSATNLIGNDGVVAANIYVGGDVDMTATVTANTASSAKVFALSVPRMDNQAPVANAVVASVDEDGEVLIDINASDADGDTLSVTISTPPANGVAVVEGGKVKYTPAPNYNGSDTIAYTVTDDWSTPATSVPATITVTVNPVDDAPVLAPIADVMRDEDSGNIYIDLNATDIDGDLITYEVNSSNSAVVTVSETGSVLTLIPQLNAFGTVTVTVKATANGVDAIEEFTFTLLPLDDAPVLDLVSGATFDEDQNAMIIVSATDVEGDPIVYSATDYNASLIDVIVAGNMITFSGLADAYGSTDVNITATANGLVDSQVITMTVNPVNDAPVITTVLNDMTVDEDFSPAITIALSADDVEGDSVTYSVVATGADVDASIIGTGTFSLRLAAIADANGDANITVTANDGSVTSDKSFILHITPVNDAPVIAVLSNVTKAEDDPAFALELNATDVDGDTLVFTASPISNTLATLSVTGSTLTVTPLQDANGGLTITVQASDGNLSDSTTFDLNITAVNDNPTADDFTVSIVTGSTGNLVDLGAHIGDVDGDTLTVTSFDPLDGLSLNAGTTTFTYDNNGSEGSFIVGYTVEDAQGGLPASATVTLIVSATPIYPVAVDDNATTDEEVAVNIPVLANDTDAVSVSNAWVVNPINGTVQIEGDNTITFTPATDRAGTFLLGYTAVSATGHEANATVSVKINDINDAPVVNFTSPVPLYLTESTAEQNQNVNVSVTDVDTDLISVDVWASSSNPSVTVQYNAGVVSVTIPAYVNSEANITVFADDGQATTTESFMVYVTAVDNVPFITTTETTVALNASTQYYNLDVQPADESFTLTLSDAGNAGIAYVQLSGSMLVIDPVSAGATTVTVHAVNDANGTLVSDTNVTVHVFDPSNVVPEAFDGSASVVTDAVTNGTVLNAYDANGDMLTYSIVTPPAHGQILALDEWGNYVYASTNAYIGEDSFSFKVSDGVLESNIATVTIYVTPSPDAGGNNDSLTEKTITLAEYTAYVAQTGYDIAMYSVWEEGWDVSNLQTERLIISEVPQQIEIFHVEQNMTDILPYTLGTDSATLLLDFDGNGTADFEAKYVGIVSNTELETEMNLTLPADAAGYKLATLQLTAEYDVWDEPEYRDWNCSVQPCVGSNPYSTLDEYMTDKSYDPNTPSWSTIWIDGYNFKFAEGSSLGDGNGTLIRTATYWDGSSEAEYVTNTNAGSWELVNVDGTDYIKVTPSVYGIERVAAYSVSSSDNLVHSGEYIAPNTAKIEYKFDETTVYYIGNSIMNRTVEALPSQPLSSATGEFISFNTLATAPLVQNEWMKAIWAYDDGMNGYTINTHGLYFDSNGSLYMSDTQDGDSNMTYQVSNDIITIDGLGIEGKVVEVITSAAEISGITGVPEGVLPALPVAYRFAHLEPNAQLDLWGDTVYDLTGSVTYSTFDDFQSAFMSGQVAVEYTPNGGIGYAGGVAGVGGTLAEYDYMMNVITPNAGTWEIIDFEGQPVMLITVTVQRYGDHNAIAFDGGISFVGRGRYSPPDSGSVELRYNPETTTAIINYLQDQNTTYGNPITYEKEIKILRNVQAVPFTSNKMYMAEVYIDANTSERNVTTSYVWLNGTGTSGDFVLSDNPSSYTYASIDGKIATVADANSTDIYKVKVNEELNASVLRTETSLYLPDSAHGYRITYMDLASGHGATEIKLDEATILYLQTYFENNPNLNWMSTPLP